MHPSTKLEATIGGFIAGGSGGPGSVTYGQLQEPGNILAAQIVTMEDTPRVLELEGREAYRIYHTYGATGIVTEIEMPTAPAWDWRETIVAFPDYMDALRFAVDTAKAPGIIKKVMSVQEWPTPHLISAFADLVPEGHSIVSTMIATQCWPEFVVSVAARGGVVVSNTKEGEGPYGQPLTHFVFGHTLLHVRKNDPRRTLIEGYFQATDLPALVERVRANVGSFGPMRLELLRTPDGIAGAGSPLFIYESPEQMAQLVRLMQEAGARVSNSHTSNVRAVGKKGLDASDDAFKRAIDPYALLNPGRYEVDPAADAKFELELPTNSWSERVAN